MPSKGARRDTFDATLAEPVLGYGGVVCDLSPRERFEAIRDATRRGLDRLVSVPEAGATGALGGGVRQRSRSDRLGAGLVVPLSDLAPTATAVPVGRQSCTADAHRPSRAAALSFQACRWCTRVRTRRDIKLLCTLRRTCRSPVQTTSGIHSHAQRVMDYHDTAPRRVRCGHCQVGGYTALGPVDLHHRHVSSLIDQESLHPVWPDHCDPEKGDIDPDAEHQPRVPEEDE